MSDANPVFGIQTRLGRFEESDFSILEIDSRIGVIFQNQESLLFSMRIVHLRFQKASEFFRFSTKFKQNRSKKNNRGNVFLSWGQIIIWMEIIWGIYLFRNEHEKIYWNVTMHSSKSYWLAQMSFNSRNCTFSEISEAWSRVLHTILKQCSLSSPLYIMLM